MFPLCQAFAAKVPHSAISVYQALKGEQLVLFYGRSIPTLSTSIGTPILSILIRFAFALVCAGIFGRKQRSGLVARTDQLEASTSGLLSLCMWEIIHFSSPNFFKAVEK